MYTYSTPRKWTHANKYNIDYCFNCKYSKSGTPFYTNTAEGISANSPSEALQILKTQLGDVENSGGDNSSSDIAIGLSLDEQYYNLIISEPIGYIHPNTVNCYSKEDLINYQGLGAFISYDESEYYLNQYYPNNKKRTVIFEKGYIVLLHECDEGYLDNAYRVFSLKDGYVRYSNDSNNNPPTQEDKRIPTICCLLVCCEPTKYKLV
jgi:hypothetical protein